MIDDYQKRIQLLRRSLGRGHLDHVPDTSVTVSHQSIGQRSSKRSKKRITRSRSAKSKKSSRSGMPINLVVKNNYNGCNFYQQDSTSRPSILEPQKHLTSYSVKSLKSQNNSVSPYKWQNNNTPVRVQGQTRYRQKRNGFELENLIQSHKQNESKKKALKNLKPGMSYQQAR